MTAQYSFSKSDVREINKVAFAIEATDYEAVCLWREFTERFGKDKWVQHNPGRLITIGTVDDRPVVVSVFYNSLLGQKIAFCEATSQLVDHLMVDKFIKEEVLVEGGQRSNAMNYHNIVHAIQRLNESNAKAALTQPYVVVIDG